MVDLKVFIKNNFPNSIRANYIHQQDVFDFLEYCNQNSWTVIGIEGFEYESPTLKARLDMIADYSTAVESQNGWSDFMVLCNSSTKVFLEKILSQNQNLNLVFDFTVYSEEDWNASRHTV